FPGRPPISRWLMSQAKVIGVCFGVRRNHLVLPSARYPLTNVMTIGRLVSLVVQVATFAGVASAAPQSQPGTALMEPVQDIPGVIRAGTQPEIVIRGLRSADDPIWLPEIGLVFTESQANRVVRLTDRDEVVTFVGDLHGPLGMTLDRQGRL